MRLDRRYWDSDCFLGWLQAEEDKFELCRQVLNRAAAGEIVIITSALTLAEVLAVRGREKIGPDKRKQVTDFFKRTDITCMSITRTVAELARELVWDHGVMPKDALHVASAMHAKVDVLNTFDADLLAKNGQMGNPGLKIEKPLLGQPDLDGL